MAAALLSLAGSEWGRPAGGEEFVQFREQQVSGFSGCNRFAGEFEIDGDKIRIDKLISTQMACLDEKVMAREREWLDMLDQARRFEATHLVLVLKDEQGREIARLNRRDFD